jgi:hypothetical protein
MGYESIWLGIFGKTLKMLYFLFNRTAPLKNWRELEIVGSYVVLDGEVEEKYRSRIDFLIYFLLALTAFNPVEVFEEVAEKTGEVYDFVPELKRSKVKWSYREFWCLVGAMRSNALEAYFKIPFWFNIYSVIYLQLLRNIRQGKQDEFMALAKWIIKQTRELTARIKESVEGRMLMNSEEDGPNGEFAFDGESFVQGIVTLGKYMFENKGKDLSMTKWEEFRDKNSIFYYFWRIDSP